MDHSRRKLLTQSVAFIQAHLNPTHEFLEALRSASVLTQEDVLKIRADDTVSGKVVELICILKKKPNAAFNQFVHVLEDNGFTTVSAMLKKKQTVSEVMWADPRTVDFLENKLAAYSISPRSIHDLAKNLVLMEVYQDDTSYLQDKITALQHDAKTRSRPKTPITPHVRSRLSSTPVPNWDAQDLLQEKDSIIAQKDKIIKKKDEEYSQLKSILDDTQADLQSVLDLNTQYLSLISQMNSIQLQCAGTPREAPQTATEEVIALEQKLEEKNAQIQELSQDLGDLTSELEDKEKQVTTLKSREKKYRKLLGITDVTDEQAVEKQIEKMISEGKMRRKEAESAKHELFKTRREKADVEEKLAALVREKEKVQFHLRQQDLTIKRMKRQKAAAETIHKTQSVLTAKLMKNDHTRLTLPSIERPVSQMSMVDKRSGNQYCMFCRQEYQPLKNPVCRTHFRPIRNGKWICCKDDCHRSPGCLQVPHFYMEITFDHKIFLTDGARYLELS